MRAARVKQHEAVKHHRATIQPKWEHSIPWFWPYAAAIELGDEGLDFFNDNLKFVREAAEISTPPRPEWATPNHVILDLNTMRLRDFSKPGASGVPVLIDPPTGEAALRLWNAVVAWTEFPHLYELQRPKTAADGQAITETFRPYLEARDWVSINRGEVVKFPPRG